MMRNESRYLQSLASILMLVILFVGCKDYDEVILGPESTGVIKAQISLSLTKDTKGNTTRQTATTVQNETSFRGLSDIKLIPFIVPGEGDVTAEMVRIGRNIVLPKTSAQPAIGSNNQISASLLTGANAQTYADVDLMLGTNAFLFYGAATLPSGGEGGSMREKQVNGAIKENGLTLNKPSDMSFEHVRILNVTVDSETGTEIVTPDSKATALVEYLNTIAGASKTTDDVTETWSESNNMALKKLYLEFQRVTAGSSANIQAMVQELYTSLFKRTDNVSAAIKSAILTLASDKGGNTPTGELQFDSSLNGYPANIGLPDGAACVRWNDTEKKFVINTDQTFGQFAIANIKDYVYPASLYYRGNTRIMTSSSKWVKNYEGKTSWDTMDGGNYATTSALSLYEGKGAIISTTKSVALINPVNYSVGRLDVTVVPKTGGAVLTSLEDNNGEMFDVSETSTLFQVKGILIGGQNRKVDWEFLPKENGSAVKGDKTVYDCDITPDMYLRAGSNVTNHTLVFETVNDNAAGDGAVYVALELENKSDKIIFGHRSTEDVANDQFNLIYPGCRFYLIGKIVPNNNTTTKYVGRDEYIKKAFVQDYVTIANFQVNNLKNAYNTLPDLRSPQLELGLSVDLSWKQGIVQTIIVD